LYIETLITNKEYKQMSDLMTISEVAQLLRVDGTTVRRWVQQGALEAIVLPHMNKRQAYRIKRETVSKILGEGQPQQ
jgi:excisionase family DNA binding protein